MGAYKKIAINSVSIYTGVIINSILSILTVPILLKNLGTSDYGLYSLIAGLIAMMSFMKASMIVTVQRFLNVSYGANDYYQVNKIFSVSLFLYVVIGLFSSIFIELAYPFIKEQFLNIDENRIEASFVLIHILVVSTLFSTVSVPYDSLFNAHEEMWLLSILNCFDYLLRLVFAVIIGFSNKSCALIIYAYYIGGISFLLFIVKLLLCKLRYKEIKLIKIGKSDFTLIKKMFSFIGWNLFSTLAKMFSTQGFAVILNMFKGTSINAAYGIANQVNSSMLQLSSSVDKAFNPQIMKSEGMNNRNRVIDLSVLSTRYCSLVFSLFAVPFLFSLPYILKIWLSDIPNYTIAFSRIIIVSSMVSMLTVGISSIFYAINKIKSYLITLGIIYIFIVFVGYALMKLGFSPTVVMLSFIFGEIVLFFVRLYFSYILVNLDTLIYIRSVLFPYLKVVLPSLLIVSFFPCDNLLQLILLFSVSFCVYILLVYFLCLDNKEKSSIKLYVHKLSNSVFK